MGENEKAKRDLHARTLPKVVIFSPRSCYFHRRRRHNEVVPVRFLTARLISHVLMQQISPFYLPTETVTILVEFFFLQLFAVPTGWEESHKFKRFRRAQEELVSSNISLSNPSSWLTVRKNMGRGPVAGRWKTHFAPRGPLRRTGPLKPTRNVIWQPCDLAAEIFFFSSFFDKDLKKEE